MVKRLTAAVTLACLFGCENSLDRPIRFVLPENHHGPFIVIEHRDYPDAIVAHPDRYELTVPANGVVRTNDAWIFGKWHEPPGVIECGSTRYRNSGPQTLLVNWFFVGTQDEADRFYWRPNSENLQEEWLANRDISLDSLAGDKSPP